MRFRWDDARAGDIEARNEIVLAHMGLVRTEARRVTGTNSKYLELDNVTADGVVGLLEAVDKYEPERGVPFDAFARPRIRGEMQEGLRRAGTWGAPGTIRERRREARVVAHVEEDLQARLGRGPTAEEIAKEVGWKKARVELAQAFEFESEVLRLGFGPDGLAIDLDDDGVPEAWASLAYDTRERGVDVEGIGDIGELSDRLVDAQEALPERERVVYALYYFQHLKFTEIAELLDVSVARVSQVHTAAVAHIRDYLLTGTRDRHRSQ